MAELHAWTVSAGGNNGAAPNGAPEGQTAGSVNDSIREGMAVLARFDRDNDGSLTTGGTTTAYTLTLNSQHAAWYTGLRFRAKINATCGATPTINPTGSAALGAKSLYFSDGTQVTTGGLLIGGFYDFAYDGTNVQVIGVATPVPAATTSVAGKVELATQAEVNTGTDTVRAMTPDTLTGWTPAVGTVTAVAADKVLLADASASGVLKQALISDFLGREVQSVRTNLLTTLAAQGGTGGTPAVATGLTVTITPSTGNDVRIRGFINVSTAVNGCNVGIIIKRDSTSLIPGAAASNRLRVHAMSACEADATACIPFDVLDVAPGTSAFVYTVEVVVNQNQTWNVNRTQTDTDSSLFFRSASVIEAIEIKR